MCKFCGKAQLSAELLSSDSTHPSRHTTSFQRLQDAYRTSQDVYRTSTDVETTSCVYWDGWRNKRPIDEVDLKLSLKLTLAKNKIWQLHLLGSIVTVHFNDKWSSEVTSDFNFLSCSELEHWSPYSFKNSLQ